MSPFSSRRPSVGVGLVAGVALSLLISAALVPLRSDISPATPALLLVLPVVLSGVVGGRLAALVTAVAAAACFNSAFIPPYWTAEVAIVDDVVALGVLLTVAAAVGTFVAREGERRRAADQAAEEIRALHARYEAVVAERERLAEETTRLAVLEQVDEQRSALLRSVSHDLRTPLATIRAVTFDLRAEAAYDDATRQNLLDLVGDEAERLDRIVANLLSLSRIEAGALQPDRQAVAVDELVGDRVRRLDRLFRQVRIQIDLPVDLPLVDGDYSQLDQVLTNLLENAARHAPQGSTVRVGARPRGGMVEVWVADEGTLCRPLRAQPRLPAVPSRQGQRLERRGPGHLSRHRRGSWGKDRRRWGPRRRGPVLLHRPGSPWMSLQWFSSSTTSKPSPMRCGPLWSPVATECSLPPRDTGALDTLASERLSLIVLDLGLPDLDGIEVCRLVRQSSDVPIIVLSANGADDRKVAALDEGADDYVTKPFSMPELMARVRVALRHRQTADNGDETVLEVGDVRIDLPRHAVTVDGRQIELTPKEFGFLAVLARHPSRVITHRRILKEVWGPDYGTETQYLRVYASQLRKELDDDPAPRV